ncbi:MAG: hypothetical protein Pg6C_04290 [Treponemataceae bacterium]|nr:MAG: hypothetical protein Pg6C_04290 [Treponemataceae bacterium]
MNKTHTVQRRLRSKSVVALCSLLTIHFSLFTVSCNFEKSRALTIGEVAITGQWKGHIKVEPGKYTVEPGKYTIEDDGKSKESYRARINLRLTLISPYAGQQDNPAASFALVALSKSGAEMDNVFTVVSADKFNELARGKAGDSASITFETPFDWGNAKWLDKIAGFDGRTEGGAAGTSTSASAGGVPASGPRNTDTDPVFNPRTEARTGRRIVAVPEFTVTKSISEDLAVSFTAAVTTGLANNKNINRVVDYNQINRIMKQHKFEASDWSNPAKYAEIGKALNVDTIAVGTISLGGKVLFVQDIVVAVQLIDISTMAVAGSFTETGAALNLPVSLERAAGGMKVSQ